MRYTIITVALLALGILLGSMVKSSPEILPVADLQRKLNELGFPCPVDGLCGAKTHAARLAYEKAEITKSADYWYRRMEME